MIVDGTKMVATLALTGAYSNATFSVQSDGHGGTDITMTTADPFSLAAVQRAPSSHAFIAAMAALGSASGWAVHVGTPIDLERPSLMSPGSQFA